MVEENRKSEANGGHGGKGENEGSQAHLGNPVAPSCLPPTPRALRTFSGPLELSVGTLGSSRAGGSARVWLWFLNMVRKRAGAQAFCL